MSVQKRATGYEKTRPKAGFFVEISFVGTRCSDVHLGDPRKTYPEAAETQ